MVQAVALSHCPENCVVPMESSITHPQLSTVDGSAGLTALTWEYLKKYPGKHKIKVKTSTLSARPPFLLEGDTHFELRMVFLKPQCKEHKYPNVMCYKEWLPLPSTPSTSLSLESILKKSDKPLFGMTATVLKGSKEAEQRQEGHAKREVAIPKYCLGVGHHSHF